MALYVVLFCIGIGIIGSVVSAVIKARKEATAKRKVKECAYKIVTMHNKYCPNDNITYNVEFDSIVNRNNTLIIYGSFEKFFKRHDPASCGKWSDTDIEQFNSLMLTYRINKGVYKNQRSVPNIRTYSENTGNAKLDAINAQYNASIRQAISNQAASIGMKKPKSAAGAMVKGAVVGKVIGGDAGAVVGAMVAKEKHDKANEK